MMRISTYSTRVPGLVLFICVAGAVANIPRSGPQEGLAAQGALVDKHAQATPITHRVVGDYDISV